MTSEEVRLRALLSIRTGDKKYLKDIPSWMQFAGLYPEIIRPIKMDNQVLEEMVKTLWEERKKYRMDMDMDEEEIKTLKNLLSKEHEEESLKELKDRLDREYDTNDLGNQ